MKCKKFMLYTHTNKVLEVQNQYRAAHCKGCSLPIGDVALEMLPLREEICCNTNTK